MQLHPYQGTAHAPYPPAPASFRDVPAADRYARGRASALLGVLPLYHFVDERGPAGVYRYFCYETPIGVSVGAVCSDASGTLGMLGITNADFVAPPPGSAAGTAGAPLLAAASALVAYFNASGVPAETTDDPQVLAFQTAWNADPLSQQSGANSALSADGSYEPNTHDALAAIVGSGVPAVNPGPTPPTQTTFTLAQLRALAVSTGFPDPDTAAAIAMAESHIAGSVPDQANPSATNIVTRPAAGNLPERSFGLWQINTLAHPQYNETQLLDPTYNAQAAFAVSQSGTTWKPWSTYTSGAYLRYMPATPAAPAATSAAPSSQGIAALAGTAIVFTLASLLVTTAWNSIGRSVRA